MVAKIRPASWFPALVFVAAQVLPALAVAGDSPPRADAADTAQITAEGGVARASVTRVPTGPIVVPAGMPLTIELAGNLGTRTSRVGDRVEARLAHDLVVLDERVAAVAGAHVTGTVTAVESGLDGTALPTLEVTFDSLVARNGATVPIRARYRQQGAHFVSEPGPAGGDLRLRAGTVVEAKMETTISIY
jgi:hypothetical protein